MSLTLNMTGGGAGGASPNKALIRVFAPSGSQIQFSLNGTVMKTLNPQDAVIDVDDYNVIYYYSIPQNNFGLWSISRIINGTIRNASLTVDSIKIYEINLRQLVLYNEGVFETTVSGGATAIGRKLDSDTAGAKVPTINYDNNKISFSISNGAGGLQTNNSIDLTNYNTIYMTVGNVSTSSNYYASSKIVSEASGYLNNSSVATYSYPNGTSGTIPFDISYVTGAKYIMIVYGSIKSGTIRSEIYSYIIEG